ncbi:MAG: hypothetical protein ABSD20_15270 [Terriglobales bacterium]
MSSPEQLAHAIQDFLADTSSAVILENGALVFDFETARYSLSTDYGKCVLHLWSAERNSVRRVVGAEVKNGILRLSVLRFGQAKPSLLEICRDRDLRSPTQRRAARVAYQQLLRTMLERKFFGLTITQLSTSMDLEHSFSPVYTRGLLQQGASGFAIFGVNAQEQQSAIDGAVTFGLLWFHYCRERGIRSRGRQCHVGGLKLFVPPGTGAVARERLAHLNPQAASWQLYEFDEKEGDLIELDTADRGNIATRLIQCPDQTAARERFAGSIQQVLAMLPDADIVVLSSAEVSFRLRGLEIARARLEPEAGSFRPKEQIVFGAGKSETVLNPETEALFKNLAGQASAIRRASGARNHALWRMTPERWLESELVRNVAAIDERLNVECVYSQVPAFAAGDRSMIDVLAITRAGRLAVLELKADEDIHLPLQGIDYWARVEWHRARGEFQRFGYFSGHLLAAEAPMLLLVAPALHVHPATDTLLRYLSPDIDCTLVGIDEHWREGVRVVFRKRRES